MKKFTLKKRIDLSWLDQITLANRITLLRILFIPLCLVFILTTFYGLATVVFMALAFSDAIDGYIARKYNQVSELGKQLDPLADKILVLTVLIGLTSKGLADPMAVMIICAREFIIASIRTKKIFAASPIAKWKTGSQVLAIFMLLLNLPLAWLVLWAAVFLSLLSGWAYLWQSQILNQLWNNTVQNR